MTPRIIPAVNPSARPGRPLPAQTRIGQYQIESLIATGPLSIVYRAIDHVSRQVVAIKEYVPADLTVRNAKLRVSARNFADSARFLAGRQAFLTEARSLMRFRHPCLLKILELLESNGTVYRVMTYSPGPTLLEHRHALGQMPALEDFRRWLDGLRSVLALMHEHDCLHGAVTPANILLRPGEHPLLLDFGAVRRVLADDSPAAAVPVDDQCFLPLELRQPAAQRPVGPWSDLYALAASLHYGLSGQLPAASGDVAVFEPFADLWQRERGMASVSPDLHKLFGVLDACLRHDPRHRPQSVADFDAWVAGDGAPAVPALPEPLESIDPSEAAPAPQAPAGAVVASAVADTDADTNVDTNAVETSAQPAVTVATLDRSRPAEPVDEVAAAPSPVETPVPQSPSIAPVMLREDAETVVPDDLPPMPPAAARHRMAWATALAGVLVFGVAMWASHGPDAPMPTAMPTAAVDSARPDAPALPRPEPAPAALPAPVVAVAPPTIAVPDPAAILDAAPPGAGPPVPTAAAVVEPPQAQAAAPPRPPAPASRRPSKQVVAQANAKAPREACASRTGFALYQCMQMQCAKSTLAGHEQCVRLRRSDAID